MFTELVWAVLNPFNDRLKHVVDQIDLSDKKHIVSQLHKRNDNNWFRSKSILHYKFQLFYQEHLQLVESETEKKRLLTCHPGGRVAHKDRRYLVCNHPVCPWCYSRRLKSGIDSIPEREEYGVISFILRGEQDYIVEKARTIRAEIATQLKRKIPAVIFTVANLLRSSPVLQVVVITLPEYIECIGLDYDIAKTVMKAGRLRRNICSFLAYSISRFIVYDAYTDFNSQLGRLRLFTNTNTAKWG